MPDSDFTTDPTDSEVTVVATPGELRELVEGERDALRLRETLKAPNTTPISEVEMDGEYDLMGVVRQVNDVNHFDRDDGEQGRVRNIRIQDKTADIRVALWGEHTDLDLQIGDYVHLLSATIESGYQDTLEASVGWDSSIYVVDDPDDTERYVTIEVDA